MSVSMFSESWEEPAREGRLADAIEEFIRRYDWVTFPELQRRLEPFAEVRGNVALELAPNLILWAGMSEAFADTVQQLRSEKRIWSWPTVWLTYFLDGGALKMPIAKRIPKGGYKTERWLPVCLRVVEPSAAKGRRS